MASPIGSSEPAAGVPLIESLKKGHRGKRGLANRGMSAEREVARVNEFYRSMRIADIEKFPTPVKILKVIGGRVSGFIEKKSTVDYKGVMSDRRFVAFDVKEAHKDSIPLKNFSLHQVEYLARVRRDYGAKAFFLLFFSGASWIDTESYVLPIEGMFDYIRGTSRKSITREWCRENLGRVPFDMLRGADYLKPAIERIKDDVREDENYIISEMERRLFS